MLATCKGKVGHLTNMTIHKDVLRFQIAMNVAMSMHVLQAQQDLLKDGSNLWVRQRSLALMDSVLKNIME
jgi:hypothetical protein